MFSTLCTVTADTSQLAYSLQPLRGIGGIEYYHLEFDVVLQFGLTELKAQISWMEEVSVVFSMLYFPYCPDNPHPRAKKRGKI
jgi:hypothetical protein